MCTLWITSVNSVATNKDLYHPVNLVNQYIDRVLHAFLSKVVILNLHQQYSLFTGDHGTTKNYVHGF